LATTNSSDASRTFGRYVLAFAVVVITNTILSGVMILALRLIARLTS